MSKKSKSKSTSAPSTYAQPYITAAAQGVQGAFDANQPQVQQNADRINAALPGMATGAFTPDPTVGAAQQYIQGVLGSDPAVNPNLDAIVQQTGSSVSDRINSIFSSSGRTGQPMQGYALAKGLADSEAGLRYGDWNAGQQRQMQAAGMAPGLGAATYAQLAPYLQASEAAARLPYLGSSAMANGVGSLVGGYNTTTGTQSQGLGSSLAGLLGAGLSGFAAGGFKT